MAQKTIYVGYKFYPYEGCSRPIIAFDNEQEASDWSDAEEKDKFGFRDYEPVTLFLEPVTEE